VREILAAFKDDSRIEILYLDNNIRYAGAVNKIFEWAESPYIAYCDNDAWVQTPGWNTLLSDILHYYHEVGMVFSAGGSYPLKRANYTEILWGVGCFWMVKKARVEDIGGFDMELGHQEEVDFQTRLRLAGWKIASEPSVQVQHFSSSSVNPEARERINNGIINWVNKWNKYFVGPHVNYYSPNVTRFEDWPVNAIYLEEWYQQQPELQNLNAEAESVYVQGLGREVDLLRVPRWKDLYKGRII
jgi:GT2 family glycosyltransferase